MKSIKTEVDVWRSNIEFFAVTDLRMTGATPDEIWPLIRDFHYSHRMPPVAQHCFAWRSPGGLFGDTGIPLAAIAYGNPSNRHQPQDAWELKRLVRREDFNEPLSKFVGWSLRWLKANTPAPFVLSYADSGEGHHGGIYQACGFYYVHRTPAMQDGIRNKITGEFVHGRTVQTRFGTQNKEFIMQRTTDDWELAYHEHKYLYMKPLRKNLNPILRRMNWKILPYPKASAACPVDESVPTDVSQVQPLEAAP
jgi:hypothetical protein